jgi:hypothetical protein
MCKTTSLDTHHLGSVYRVLDIIHTSPRERLVSCPLQISVDSVSESRRAQYYQTESILEGVDAFKPSLGQPRVQSHL